MKPDVRKIGTRQNKEKCDMCGNNIISVQQYQYTAPLSKVILIVCRKCGMREYYGTAVTQGKIWKKEQKLNLLFGQPISE